MLHISWCVSSAWNIYGIFIALTCLYEKLLPKHCLEPFMTSWPQGHEVGSLVTIFRFRVSILPAAQCLRVFRMIFVQKRRLSIFSHWFIMERSQNWPDPRSPISKFRSINFIDVTNITRWKFQGDRLVGVAMTSIQASLRWGHLTWPGDLTLTDLNLKC